jgi:DNA-binding transcriptional ArsR family regulator
MQLSQKEFSASFFKRLFGQYSYPHAEHQHSKKLPHVSQKERVDVLRALADETRLSIVQKLLREGGSLPSCDILACASVHKLSQPAMSHHFGKLVDAGVIIESKQGTQKIYAVNRTLLEAAGIEVNTLS